MIGLFALFGIAAAVFRGTGLIAAFLLGLLATAAIGVWISIRCHSRSVSADPLALEGTASGHDVASSASAKALLRRARTLRPSLVCPHSLPT